MVFDETNDSSSRKKDAFDDDVEILQNGVKEFNLKEKPSQEEKEEKGKKQEKDSQENINKEQGDLPNEWRYAHHHPKDLIIGDPFKGIRTRDFF